MPASSRIRLHNKPTHAAETQRLAAGYEGTTSDWQVSEGSTTNLRWSNEYSFRELLSSQEVRQRYKGHPGVYIHKDHRSPRIAYVGKASGNPDLWLSQYQHYVHYIAGLYLIPEQDPSSSGYSWEPGPTSNVLDTVFDRDKFGTIVTRAFEYVLGVRIRLCALSAHDAAKVVERQLIYELAPLDTTRGKLSAPATPLELMHCCELGNPLTFEHEI